MQLETLRVFHLKKKEASSVMAPWVDLDKAFYLDTCQRWIWISGGDACLPLKETPGPGNLIEELKGLEAYRFLLRFAAGLESEVVGETDVFGQFKDAWRKVKFTGSFLSLDLGPWIQRVFEDTKEIRTQYLQNIGGSSYGSLVRKLLRDSSAPLLIVGAGQMAKAVVPFLGDHELWLCNRNSENLDKFHQEIAAKPGSRVKKLEGAVAQAEGWRRAGHVIVCVPGHLQEDEERIRWFREGGTENRSLIHLGVLRSHSQGWNEIPHFHCLDDLFSLQSSIKNVRSVQISRAEKACEERAKLRAMGTSLSIPHGWEDLACFA